MVKIEKVFIAGPLFSESERWLGRRIVELCENLGFKTFWSWRDAENIKKYSLDNLFITNKGNLDKCDLVIVNLDGSDVDSGTAWEIGYAVAKDKPVIGVRTDFRIHTKDLNINLMAQKSCLTIVSDLEELRKAIIELTKSE